MKTNMYRIQLTNPRTGETICKYFECDSLRNLRGWIEMTMPQYWKRGGKFIHAECKRVARSDADGATVYNITSRFGIVKTCVIHNEIINHLMNK